jgi:hypothetical protein
LTKVRVQPINGPAFELHDPDGVGRDQSDVTANQVVPVQWTLFKWH